MSLGTKIKELRSKSGLTQRELSEQLNVTAQAVSRWESDEVEPSVNTIKQMASIFNVSTDELLGNESEPTVVEKIVEVEKPIIVEKPVIIEKEVEKVVPNKAVIAVCSYCNKPIYDGDKFSRYTTGRNRSERFIHEDCARTKENVQKRLNAETNRKRLVWNFIGGGLAFALLLVIFIISGVNNTKGETTPIIVTGIVLSILAFTTVGSFILSNNFLFDLWSAIAGWSVRFPGIIFTADWDGLKFLIVMKLIFAVLSVVISVVAFILATIIALPLSIIAYPLGLVRNIKFKEVDHDSY